MVEDFLNASFNELVRRWGAVKRDTYYEVAALRAPWALAAPFRASLKAGARYELRGVSISLGGGGEAYVVLTNGEVGYGFIYAEGRRRLLILDEPTEHLDEIHRRRIAELVRDLSRDVKIVVVTSHLGEFEEVADHRILL